MLALLRTFSWQEWRHHPWRHAAAVLAVALGVALAFSVHLINASALDEFAGAIRATGGQPDLELRAASGEFDEAFYAQLGNHPDVAVASPVLELQTVALTATGERRSLRVLGLDALVAPRIAPALAPLPAADQDRLSIFAARAVFLNPAAQSLFAAGALRLQSGLEGRDVRVAGSVAASGPALAVMDIGAAQDLFGRQGRLTRIDIRLRAGTSREAFLARIRLSPGMVAAEPGDAEERVGGLSRAYRVNLTVLALVALFTGAFLVYSVLALGVAKRAQQFALLAVLGLTPQQRGGLVLAESAAIGLVGSLAGIALGTALAGLALRLLGGDLGGGYFPGVAPSLQWSLPAAVAYAVLGIAAALAGGWFPARAAQRLAPAQALKGAGTFSAGRSDPVASVLLIASGILCAFMPPIAGIPVAAYGAVGLLLVGGITLLPWLVALVYDGLAPRFAHKLLPLLAVERTRRVRESAAVAVSGVVAAFALAVALIVMVASFRDSVGRWLDVLLPADLYLRTASSTASADTVFLPPEYIAAVSRLPGVDRVLSQRVRPLLLDAARPTVALLARPVDDPDRVLPLVAPSVNTPAGHIPVYVSEAMVDLYGARAGQPLQQLSAAFATDAKFAVAGVWRDYVRQSGAIVIDGAHYQRLTGDRRANELHLWLAQGTDTAAVQRGLRETAARLGHGGDTIEIASAAQLRSVSMRIFDRSFAVTYWLQSVAIGIGLFGVAASFGAQVLARRKEFGLLAHLGLTRRQVLGVVAGEGAAWTFIGALAGIGMGLAVAVVLIHVVNPQSFHWTMDMRIPWERLLALGAAVVLSGTLTAWIAGRAAASRDAVLAVKEDW